MTPDYGRPHHHHRLTDSTNDRARVLAEAGAPSGTIVTAAEQSAGRGRRGRSWSAPGGALLYTAILRPLEPRHSLLPLAVALAVAEAVEALAPATCELKWPNDVWIARRKTAGILIESRPPRWALIGIGLNVAIPDGEFPGNLRWPATSVGHGATVEAALAASNKSLARWTVAPPERALAEFRRRDALLGRELSWTGGAGDASEGAGKGAGIDDDGNLLVDTEDGRRVSLGSGEVELALDPPAG